MKENPTLFLSRDLKRSLLKPEIRLYKCISIIYVYVYLLVSVYTVPVYIPVGLFAGDDVGNIK